MSARLLINACVNEAHGLYPELKKKWNGVYMRLFSESGMSILGMHNQADGTTDLVVRVLEDEAVNTPADKGVLDSPWAQDMHQSLSKYWILSTYEAMRTARAARAGTFDSRLEALYKEFQLVRVPITKLEIANDWALKQPIMLERVGDGPASEPEVYGKNAKSKYMPPMMFNALTGSLGWLALDAVALRNRLIYRRALSDQLLQIFD